MKIMIKRAMIAAFATPLFLVAGASAASAAAPDDGCARGFEHWDITNDEPYMGDNLTDAAGNDDGWVCARALGEGVSKTFGVDFTIYLWTDNDLTPGSID